MMVFRATKYSGADDGGPAENFYIRIIQPVSLLLQEPLSRLLL